MEYCELNIEITPQNVLFFDLDGTLVDSNLANFEAYKLAIKSTLNKDYRLIYNPQVRFNRSILKSTFSKLTDSDFENIIEFKENCFDEFLNLNLLIQENVDVLSRYSKTNECYLVTNCRKDRALKILNHFGLIDKFSNFFFRHFDDRLQKINKFQNALVNLSVPPNLVIAFENEGKEIEDALNAGISIINPKLPK